MVLLPLAVGGRQIGVVELTSHRTEPLGERRLALAQSLAAEAATAIENNQLYGELRHRAFHDPLTGLPNRTLFEDRVAHALALRTRRPRRQRVAVCFLDLDDFKTVNDRLGHAQGDRFLIAVAERLRRALRQGDTAARLGGDEFGILLEELADQDTAAEVVQRLMEAFHQPLEVNGDEVLVAASIGIAVDGLAGESVDELLRNADFAMYRAKAAGKGRFEVFQPGLRDGLSERAELQERLKGAASRDELRLHFQPLIDLQDGRLVGVEALVRWQPPDRPLISPTIFVPLAEASGAIVPIGRWVLRNACEEGRRLRELTGRDDLTVAVNVSARQFAEPTLLDSVRLALADSGLPPDALVLEITETVLMDAPVAAERLAELRNLGVRIAIDDFGTGYSSLGYLERFPVDLLKIDKSFVDRLDHGREGAVLARAIVQVGRALRLQVVGEGIERPEQLAQLQRLGCRLGQGFLLAPPLEPGELEATVTAKTPPWQEHFVARFEPARSAPPRSGPTRLTSLPGRLASRRSA
ncbi:MAG TPA: EAL domain-containing protein, partial [Candidatus Limnocylindrales bacterium]|nr:EAL domain-containing protein [Candidatus Limnocylindrales bacterium]